MATYTSNYAWTKPSGGDPVDIEVLNDNLDDQDSIVHQAFLDLAPVFSTANTYAVKDVVLYDNKVWICHTAVTTAGAWTGSTNWTQTTVGETGGVATYADLPDKPSINGNELSGNKTGAQLGLQNALTFDNVPTANSTNPVKSGGVYASDEAIRQWTTAEAKSVSGNPITLTDGSARNAEGLVVTLEPKQSGSGTPSPTNVRPITGYTECVVDRDGKNLLDESQLSSGNIAYLPIYVGSGNFTLSSDAPLNTSSTANLFLLTGNVSVGIDTSTNGVWNAQSRTVSSTNGYVTVASRNLGDVNPHDYHTMLERGTSATPYVPYSHYNITITFGQTVYGGSVDFKTGKVTVTHKYVSLNWGTYSRSDNMGNNKRRILATLSDAVGTVDGALNVCDCLPEQIGWNTDVVKFYIDYQSKAFIAFMPNDTSSDTTINACYELATPIELTLTPAELELLKGYNYITTNGTTIALDYLPDSLLAEAENYVDAKIPPAPSSDGTYVLTCTVTSGTPAYSWESAT